MRRLLTQSWWHVVLRGVAALAFGVLALAWPGATLLFLAALFAAYALLSGLASLAGALRNRGAPGWWLVLLLGLASIAAAVLALFYPGITVVALVVIMGVNALFSGALDIAMAVQLRREIRGEWLLALIGVVSVLFGLFILFVPAAGVLALVWLVAVYAIAAGVLLVSLGLRLRSMERDLRREHSIQA